MIKNRRDAVDERSEASRRVDAEKENTEEVRIKINKINISYAIRI